MRVRSPLLAQSLICSLLLRLLRCFSSAGLLLLLAERYYAFSIVGCPIGKSQDQFVFADPPGLSQLITSFLASKIQGILHTPLITFFSPALIITQLFILAYYHSNELRVFREFFLSWNHPKMTPRLSLSFLCLFQYVKELRFSRQSLVGSQQSFTTVICLLLL